MTRDPKKVFIGVCLRSGDVRWETFMSLFQEALTALPGYSFVIKPGGGCDVAHARNLLLHDWRTRTDCGRLVWIDSDVVWGDQLKRLLAWDVPYVGGLYPLKGVQCRWSWNGWAKPSAQTPGLWSVEELCTGFTSMRYDLLEELIRAYGGHTKYAIEDNAYRGEQGFELCSMGPMRGTDRRLPEDFMLTRRIRALGYEANVDPTILVGHVGSVDLLEMHRAHSTFAPPALTP